MKVTRQSLADGLSAKGIGLFVVFAVIVAASWFSLHRVAHARTPAVRLAPLEQEMDDAVAAIHRLRDIVEKSQPMDSVETLITEPEPPEIPDDYIPAHEDIEVEFEVRGSITRNSERLALINGELHHQGSVVRGHTVEVVTEDSVTLRDPEGNAKTFIIGEKPLSGSIYFEKQPR